MELDKLHNLGWVDKHKPFWWNIDYKPDPREKLSLDEFLRRLEYVEYQFKDGEEKRVPIYIGDKVPVVTHSIEFRGDLLDLFITARPYNESEIKELCSLGRISLLNVFQLIAGNIPPIFDLFWPIDMLRETAKEFNRFPLYLHFIPHVRGLLRHERNDVMFWNPVLSEDFANNLYDLVTEKIHPGMIVWTHVGGTYDTMGYQWYRKVGAETYSLESPSHLTCYQELKRKHLISWKNLFKLETGGLEEVAYDEFICNLGGKEMLGVYPIRHPNLQQTIPLVLGTRTHKESKRYGATVLGVMSVISYSDCYGIWRLRDREFCRDVKEIIFRSLETDFDVVYFSGGNYHLV